MAVETSNLGSNEDGELDVQVGRTLRLVIKAKPYDLGLAEGSIVVGNVPWSLRERLFYQESWKLTDSYPRYRDGGTGEEMKVFGFALADSKGTICLFVIPNGADLKIDLRDGGLFGVRAEGHDQVESFTMGPNVCPNGNCHQWVSPMIIGADILLDPDDFCVTIANNGCGETDNAINMEFYRMLTGIRARALECSDIS